MWQINFKGRWLVVIRGKSFTFTHFLLYLLTENLGNHVRNVNWYVLAIQYIVIMFIY